jgi:phospholipid/cholesterol/gamma-HCH transport system permease protein
MNEQNQISFGRSETNCILIRLSGAWSIQNGLCPLTGLEAELARHVGLSRIAFDSKGLGAWDSSILTFLTEVSEFCSKRGLTIDWTGLPAGLRRLIALAEAVPERAGARKEVEEASLFERIGTRTMGTVSSMAEMLGFVGEMTTTFVRLFGMKARFRGSDLWLLIQQCGAEALPIVTLISFLVGVILAFVGAVQFSSLAGRFTSPIWLTSQ